MNSINEYTYLKMKKKKKYFNLKINSKNKANFFFKKKCDFRIKFNIHKYLFSIVKFGIGCKRNNILYYNIYEN